MGMYWGALALCICRDDRGILGAEMDVPRSVTKRVTSLYYTLYSYIYRLSHRYHSFPDLVDHTVRLLYVYVPLLKFGGHGPDILQNILGGDECDDGM